MKNNLEQKVKNINNYLEGFTDAEGNTPCQLKTAVLIEGYCNEYNKSLK